jgi:DNA-binding protein YbaB
VDNADLRARADELMGELTRLRSGLGDLQRTLTQVRASATSDDGLVTATVGPRGQLIRLDLDRRIYRRPDAVQLASTITETIQRASAAAQEKVAAACRPYVPDAELQAHLDFDFAGIMRRMDHELDGLNRGGRQ